MSFELALPANAEVVHLENVDVLSPEERQRFFDSSGDLEVTCVGSKLVEMLPGLEWENVGENVYKISHVLLEALLFQLF